MCPAAIACEVVPDDETFVGVSDWARAMRAEIRRVAPYSSSVLISGPTGTGKELIARAIHRHSPRRDRPFIAVDCAAVTGTLFTSHLFGHVRGAFTGADRATPGYFRAAHGGTLFFDEVGELEQELQAKLLRVLQERTVTPLGSHKEIAVDVRIITATNRDLGELVRTGKFREDLYFRLNVVSLKTIPLKDRLEDLGDLAEHILANIAISRARAGEATRRPVSGLFGKARLARQCARVAKLLRARRDVADRRARVPREPERASRRPRDGWTLHWQRIAANCGCRFACPCPIPPPTRPIFPAVCQRWPKWSASTFVARSSGPTTTGPLRPVCWGFPNSNSSGR